MTKARHQKRRIKTVAIVVDVMNDQSKSDNLASIRADNKRTNSIHLKRTMWISVLWLDKMVHFPGMQIIYPTESEVKRRETEEPNIEYINRNANYNVIKGDSNGYEMALDESLSCRQQNIFYSISFAFFRTCVEFGVFMLTFTSW